MKKIKVDVTEVDQDTEEIEDVKNALKWPHFVMIHAPLSEFKRNLAFSLLDLGKNSAEMGFSCPKMLETC